MIQMKYSSLSMVRDEYHLNVGALVAGDSTASYITISMIFAFVVNFAYGWGPIVTWNIFDVVASFRMAQKDPSCLAWNTWSLQM